MKFSSVKDSGSREEFATGSRRDTQEGKPRYDLIPLEELERLAMHYSNGAAKYGDSNWKKGQPVSRLFASLMRHTVAFIRGQDDEDHMAACLWNIIAISWMRRNKPELDDYKST